MALQKILVIYTGGTFGMRPQNKIKSKSSNLEIQNLSANELKNLLKKQVPEMMQIASCDVDVLFNLDSCQFQATHWFELAAHVAQNQNRYDGVVILHGTDTLAFTASALAYLLSPVKIPIVLTGAQKPLALLRNDARANFISALEVASQAPKALRNRVSVVFHDEVFLGSRVRKKSAMDFAAFESPRFPKLASIGSSIQYHEILAHLPKLKSQKTLLDQFKRATQIRPLPQILPIQITPQFCSKLFTENFLAQLDGILLTLYTSGTAPTTQDNFIQFLKRAQKVHTPIFVITEREDETPPDTYSAGCELIQEGVLWCNRLTPEAAFVKIWLLREFHSKHSREDHFKWLQKNWDIALADEL